MSTVTLEQIKAEHQRIGDLINAFEAQHTETMFHFPEAMIQLRPGENYAGLIIGHDGEPSHHLILIPGQADDVTWEEAMDWAGKQGGEYVAHLPTRREQELLFANLKSEFEERYYWSCEAHESESGWAWYQYFDNGTQLYNGRNGQLRARAVRRLVIE